MNSRLLSIEGENFMGYSYFRIDFDDTNIISLKGYNSSGKTTILRAYAILNFDLWNTKQLRFIKHGETFFRLKETFSDGVEIVREKHANSKSAYHLYKDGELYFSTVQDGVYTSVKGVPDYIQRYLNFIGDDVLNLHFRRGRDGLLLVDTTGKQNYEFLSNELKTEELTLAINMVKSDRSDIKTEVYNLEREITSYKEMVKQDRIVTEGLVEYLEGLDKRLQQAEDKKKALDKLTQLIERYNEIKPSIRLGGVDVSKVERILKLTDAVSKYNQLPRPTAQLEGVGLGRFGKLGSIINRMQEYNKYEVKPRVDEIYLDKVTKLTQLATAMKHLQDINTNIKHSNSLLQDTKSKVQDIQTQIHDSGVIYFKCNNCGEIHVEGEHQHA